MHTNEREWEERTMDDTDYADQKNRQRIPSSPVMFLSTYSCLFVFIRGYSIYSLRSMTRED